MAHEDIDQRPDDERGAGAAAAGAVVEGASLRLDARMRERQRLADALASLETDILDGIEEEREQLRERLRILDGQHAHILGTAPRLVTAPDDGPRHRANGATTEGSVAAAHPVDKIAGVHGVTTPPPRELAPVADKARRRVVAKTRAPKKAKKTEGGSGVSLNARFIAHVAQHPGQSNKQIGAAIGLEQQRAASIANGLKRAGKLKKHGSGKAITWSVA